MFLYKITNTENGKIYIGVSDTPERRFNEHMRRPNKLMSQDVESSGVNFVQEILFEGNSSLVLGLERDIVNSDFVNDENTYNMTIGGGTPPKATKESSKKSRDTRTRLIREGKISPPPRLSNESQKKSARTRKRLIEEGKLKPPPRLSAESQKKAAMTRSILHAEGVINLHPKNETLYIWLNNEGEEIVATQYELTNKYGLPSGNVCNVLKGRTKSVLGWKLKGIKK